MERPRRPFDRSLSKEPILRKPRLSEDQPPSDRSFNVRPGYAQRPPSSNSGVGARAQRDRDSESSDSLRGPSKSQQQHGQLLHMELVKQYKNALLELTFNSKPIITNLTIIAGENLHAAKAIAATVCIHILEVPKDQKLPSLYLLDSIVKNIGEDYIKYFDPRLPEVFCKAYRQVDPSTHQSMRHLFGTWKGVFPSQTLQIIEKDLGFATSTNGSSSGVKTLKPDTQTQHSSGHAHSIHVNPKYLEARQRLPTTSSRGSAVDISGAIASSSDEVEAPARMNSVKIHQRNPSFSAREKLSSMPYLDSEYGSSVSDRLGIETERANKKLKAQEFDRTWYDSSSDVISERLPSQKNGFGMKNVETYVDHPSRKSPIVVNKSWQNSEEEEFTWDDLKARTVGHGTAQTADSLFKDAWTPSYKKVDFDRHQQLSIDDPALVGFVSTKTGPVVSEAQISSRNFMNYSDDYSSGSDDLSSTIEKASFQSQLQSAHNRGQNLSIRRKAAISQPGDSVTQLRQMHAAPSSKRPALQKRPPFPSVRNLDQQPNKFGSNRGSARLTDPRRSHELKQSSSSDQALQDPLPLPTQDVHRSSEAKLNARNLRSSSSTHASQQKKNAPSTKLRKLELSELETATDGKNLFSSQGTASKSHSTKSSSSDHSNHVVVEVPGQSIGSKYLTAGAKTVLVNSSIPFSSSSDVGFQEDGIGQSADAANLELRGSPPLDNSMLLTVYSQEEEEKLSVSPSHPTSSVHGVGVEDLPSTISSSSNQVSSLLSSLLSKGLISGSRSDAVFSSSTQNLNQPLSVLPLASSTASTSDSSVLVTREEALLSVTNEPSSSELPTKVSDGLPQAAVEAKSLIGVEFRPDIIRNLHPDVLAELFSGHSHQCPTCFLGLKFPDSVAKHMEWHAMREETPLNRHWYPSLSNWISEIDQSLAGDANSDLGGESGLESEGFDNMVPADETQSACILCGNLFEGVYSLERNEWMFKGAVYLNIPTEDLSELSGDMSNSTPMRPIVHVDCDSQDFIQSFAMHSDVKLEKDA